MYKNNVSVTKIKMSILEVWKNCFILRSSKIERPIPSFWSDVRYLCFSKSKNVWESGPYHRLKTYTYIDQWLGK